MILLAIIVVALIVIVIRRSTGEPLNVRDLWVPPIVLTCIGLWILIRVDDLRPVDHVWLVTGSLLGVAVGYLRGRYVLVYERTGFLWQRYDSRTFLAVAVSLAVVLAFSLAATRFGVHPGARPIQLSIGLGFLGESLAVTRRARAVGVPFAPERSR